MTRTQWLPFGSHPDAEIRLLCLPHAGAGASVYRAWGNGLPPEISVCPVQPPGRERRQNELPFTSVEPLVKVLAQEIITSVRSPYAILGHSTGALCAFEVIRELRALDGPLPEHLFVAGRPAPQLSLVIHDLADLPLDELARVLRDLGGTPEEILANDGLLKRMQPLLAADFSVNERYTYRPGPPLNIPITAFGGRDDQTVELPRLAAWREHTTADFTMRTLDGGHFAIFDNAAEVHACIASSLRYSHALAEPSERIPE
jgi:medium-chain acyl-[acyl-carrier-protein] hydrolase